MPDAQGLVALGGEIGPLTVEVHPSSPGEFRGPWIHIHDTENGSRVARFHAGGAVQLVSFRGDGAALASRSRDGAIKVWDLGSENPLTLQLHGTAGVETSDSTTALSVVNLDPRPANGGTAPPVLGNEVPVVGLTFERGEEFLSS